MVATLISLYEQMNDITGSIKILDQYASSLEVYFNFYFEKKTPKIFTIFNLNRKGTKMNILNY